VPSSLQRSPASERTSLRLLAIYLFALFTLQFWRNQWLIFSNFSSMQECHIRCALSFDVYKASLDTTTLFSCKFQSMTGHLKKCRHRFSSCLRSIMSLDHVYALVKAFLNVDHILGPSHSIEDKTLVTAGLFSRRNATSPVLSSSTSTRSPVMTRTSPTCSRPEASSDKN
jgi:hypothetical protein